MSMSVNAKFNAQPRRAREQTESGDTSRKRGHPQNRSLMVAALLNAICLALLLLLPRLCAAQTEPSKLQGLTEPDYPGVPQSTIYGVSIVESSNSNGVADRQVAAPL